MIFYHITSTKRWKYIKKEGVLWGVHGNNYEESNQNKTDNGPDRPYRYTYLSPTPHPPSYGSVVLQVEYTPKREDFSKLHNYGFDPPPGQVCTQFSVFEPILLSQVRRCFWLSLFYTVINIFKRNKER